MGVKRILRKDKHLEKNIGKNVEVRLFKKDINGNKEYRGELVKFDAETITIKTEEEIKIERKDIAQIKTIYEWGN